MPASSRMKHSDWTVFPSMMKALNLFETSVTPHPSTQRHIPEEVDRHLISPVVTMAMSRLLLKNALLVNLW
jgi:hypothetical protein